MLLKALNPDFLFLKSWLLFLVDKPVWFTFFFGLKGFFLSTENDFYMHSDEDGEIAINTSLIQAIEFSDESDGKRGAGLVSNG